MRKANNETASMVELAKAYFTITALVENSKAPVTVIKIPAKESVYAGFVLLNTKK